MSITALPREILYPILKLVGIPESQSKLDWLTVSKHWTGIVLLLLLEDVTLTDTGLRAFTARLAQDGYLVPSKVKRLSISLKGYRGRPNIEDPYYWPTAAEWESETMANMNILANSLHEFTALESFTLAASREFSETFEKNPFEPPRNYLHQEPVLAILKALPKHRLTDLRLDFYGSSLIVDPGSEEDENLHICPLISQHLSSIPTVRLRMHRICPAIFTFTPESTPTSQAPSVPSQRTITVNLSLDTFGSGFPNLCGVEGPCSHNLLLQQMQSAASSVTASTPGTDVKLVYYTDFEYARIYDGRTSTETELERDLDCWLDSTALILFD
jgi:hypothetical protein